MKRLLLNIIKYTFLIIIALVFLVPLWWVIISSVKYEGDIKVMPPQLWPNPATLQNYKWLLDKFSFGLYFLNSVMLSVTAIVGQVLSCSLGAFAFARLKFPGKRILFMLLLSTLMIPRQVTLIPTFIIFNSFHFIDTYVPLILPQFLGGAFGVFLLRQFYMTVPSELENAAKIDGCSIIGTLTRIFLPLSKPVLATLCIFTFMSQWNDLIGPVIYLSNPNKRTITVAMTLFQDSTRIISIAVTMCAAMISMLPLIILYLFAQKYFVEGLITSGLKG